MPEGLSINNANSWVYKPYSAWVRIYFDDNDRVKRIECNSEKENYRYACDFVSGIGIGSTEGEVKGVFGDPDSESIAHGFKRLHFDEYNLQFRLKKQEVEEIIVGEARESVPIGGDE